jgi:hypothetical protein
MPRLLIGNEFNEDRAGLADAKQKRTGWWAQRLLWFAHDGDVLVLPVAPDETYLRYVTSLTKTNPASLALLVPPAGEMGVGVLSPDRMLEPRFVEQVGKLAAQHGVDEVMSLHPDVSVAQLAEATGVGQALPGLQFLLQGGGRLVNSKPVFRAVAAGVGAPLPAGGVCADRSTALALASGLLDNGYPVMLKHEFRAGGRGNEILSPVPGVLPVGAQRVIVISDHSQLQEYFADRWDWLTSQGRNHFVAERYYPDSTAVFAEFAITDAGVRLGGQGEMISAPLAAAEIIPAPDLSEAETAELVEGGRRICAALHMMGYRGMLAADAIVTPDRQVLFTEYNGRITGSTHIYGVIGQQLVGADYADTRVLFEREGWPVPSLGEAIDVLRDADLLFDEKRRTGVVLAMPYNPSNSSIRYVAIAADLASAQQCRKVVESLFGES